MGGNVTHSFWLINYRKINGLKKISTFNRSLYSGMCVIAFDFLVRRLQ